MTYVMTWKFQNEVFNIKIEDKRIYYYDRKMGKLWGKALQFLPRDSTVENTIIMSRGKIPKQMLEFLRVTPEDQAEYDSAKTDVDLRELVIKDCKKMGCTLVEELEK